MLSFDLAILSLSIIYFFFSLICFYTFIRTISSKSIYKICIPFYLVMLISALIRGGKLIACDLLKNNLTRFFYFILGTPDMFFMCAYLILVWHFLNQYIINHINLANDKNIFNDDVPEIKKKINYVLYFLLPIYSIIFFIFSFLQLRKIISN